MKRGKAEKAPEPKMKRGGSVPRNLKVGNEIVLLPPIKKNIGGHLPHPPLDCPRPDFFFMDNGVLWIDLGVCVNCRNKCPRRAEYLWELKSARNEQLTHKENEKGE